jgi:hypothetical protein
MKLDRLVAAPLFCVFSVSIGAAQVSAPPHLLQDWSNRHVVFTGLTPENLGDAVHADPRAWHSWIYHARHRFEGPSDEEHERWVYPFHHGHHRKELAVDWQMPIGSGTGPWAFPAKFTFDVNAAPDCGNDFVVFPTDNSYTPGAGGSGVRASLVAFNNLYTGPGPTGICPTPLAPAAQPSVLFAYNTSTIDNGRASLSPVLSLDGQKIAFVESNSGSGSTYTAFHVLAWKAGEGTAWNSAAAPGDCSPGDSCMTTLVLNNTRSDSNSSPFVDYSHDTAYVGDDGGLLHKITPVFSGTPAEVIGGGWPVQLGSSPNQIQSPVYDSVSGQIFVTSRSSALYIVDANSGTIMSSIALGSSSLPWDPLLDSTNQTCFVFGADSSLNLSVWQFDTSGNLLRNIAAGLRTSLAFTGTFDNNYFTSPSSGLLYFAAEVNYVASLYSVGFTGKTMNASFSGPLLLSAGAGSPTPLTEIFNPTLSSARDRLFLGIDYECANGNANGCIESFDISNGFPSGVLNSYALGFGSTYSVSGIIIDNVSSSPQASSIYFDQQPPGMAFKLTQSSLQ